jgi:hypothetical protein
MGEPKPGAACSDRVRALSRHVFLALVAALALALLSGCGGGDGGGESDDGDAAAVAQNERLTTAQWDEYTAAAATFDDTLQTSTKAFRRCQDTAASSEEFAECAGGDVEEALMATEDLGQTLASFEGSVAGACSDALTQYAGAVKLQASSLNALEGILDQGSPPETAAAVDDVATAFEGVTTSAKSFTAACRPA